MLEGGLARGRQRPEIVFYKHEPKFLKQDFDLVKSNRDKILTAYPAIFTRVVTLSTNYKIEGGE